jgi:site-specific recombinase XerD
LRRRKFCRLKKGREGAKHQHRTVRKFAESLGKPLTEAQRSNVQKYLSDSITGGMKGKTAPRRLATLRQFYCFLIDEEEVSSDPTRNLPAPK